MKSVVGDGAAATAAIEKGPCDRESSQLAARLIQVREFASIGLSFVVVCACAGGGCSLSTLGVVPASFALRCWVLS